jgi:hypothetical protein
MRGARPSLNLNESFEGRDSGFIEQVSNQPSAVPENGRPEEHSGRPDFPD